MYFKSIFALGLMAFVVFPVLGQTPEPQRDRGEQARVWSFDGGSYIGVQTTEVNRGNFSKFGLRDVRGVAVEKVMEGSPAQAAGLQAGDVVIRFNGQEVSSSRMLTRLVNEVSPDHTARLAVARGGSERELTITVGRRPTPRFEEGVFNFQLPDGFPHVDVPNINIAKIPPMPGIDVMPHIDVPVLPNFEENFQWHFGASRQIGVSLIGVTKQMADNFGVAGGAMISEVRQNSPAAKAGLKAGDIIVEVDGKAIKGDGDIVRVMSERKEGDVSVTIVRGGNRHTFKVTPEEIKHNFNLQYPDHPKSPGTFNLLRPGKPGGPVPLDQLLIPGRVI